jgi:hypothetical protein
MGAQGVVAVVFVVRGEGAVQFEPLDELCVLFGHEHEVPSSPGHLTRRWVSAFAWGAQRPMGAFAWGAFAWGAQRPMGAFAWGAQRPMGLVALRAVGCPSGG